MSVRQNPEIYRNEESELDLASVDANLADKAYAEHWEHNPFASVVRRIDRDLFPEQPLGNYFRGWRKEDVKIGAFLPPRTDMVPVLMDFFFGKVEDLSQKIKPGSEEWYKFTAWTAWTQRNIHPKQDGNGRLIKAEMGLFLPKQRFFGHVNHLWNHAVDIEAIEKLARVSVKLERTPPQILINHVENKRRTLLLAEIDSENQALAEFFRPKKGIEERDLASEVIWDGINRTIVDSAGLIPRGVSRDAIAYLVQFLKDAPQRKQPRFNRRFWPFNFS